MPTLCRFYGIFILMHYGEDLRHVPHFHARYGAFLASFSIETLESLVGKLPQRAERLVIEWAALHQEELLDNWRRAERREAVKPIQPLE